MSQHKARTQQDSDGKFSFTVQDGEGNIVDSDSGYHTEDQASYHASESRDMHSKTGDWTPATGDEPTPFQDAERRYLENQE